jgi:UDP:flavonoid glycosyltransferase YjiC (YdhE family)
MRVLFTSIPLSGHLHPLLPLALAAQRAGHGVGFAVCAARCAPLARLGFSVHACGADEGDSAVARAKYSARSDVAAIDPGWAVRVLFAGIFADRMLPDLRTVVDRWRPDLIVSEVCEYAGWVIAERRGVPRAMVPFGMHWGFDVLEPMGAGPALAALRRREGLDPDRWLESLREQPCLLFAPLGYQLPGSELPSHVHLFRPEPFDQSGDETLPHWVLERSTQRPLVYATLGTAYNDTGGVLEATIEAARDEPFDLVVTVGRDRDPALVGSLPTNVRVERYVPQSLLMPYCTAVVSQAGYSTVMATLSAGLPMVLTPIGADQPFHADRCRELGTAEVVEHTELTPVRLRDAIRTVLGSSTHRARAQAVRDAMATQPGTDMAVTVLEGLVMQARP